MTLFNIKNKEETVIVFIRNLLRGSVSMEYERYQQAQSPKEFAALLLEKLKRFQAYDICPNEDGTPPEPTDWLYDAIIEGRVYGAIKGEFKEESYEERINELEAEKEKKDIEISELEALVDQLKEQVDNLTLKEPPPKKDYYATA